MMLKVNELMIGDWVKVVDHFEPWLETLFVRVQGLNYTLRPLIETEYQLKGREAWASIKYGPEHIEPIPLTEDILNLNGFEMDDEYDDGDRDYFCHGYDFNYLNCTMHKGKAGYQFSIASDDDDNVYKRCYYVHELQHALRLCGLNGLADNFIITNVTQSK